MYHSSVVITGKYVKSFQNLTNVSANTQRNSCLHDVVGNTCTTSTYIFHINWYNNGV